MDKIKDGHEGSINLHNVSYLTYGGQGDDYIEGNTFVVGSHNDQIYGWNGNDTIYAYDGNDKINGGAGNDTLYGGTGNDAYVFNGGNDTIIENTDEGKDKLELSSVFDKSTITFNRYEDGGENGGYSSHDLIIQTGDPANTVTIAGFFDHSTVETLQYGDGTWIDLTKVIINTWGSSGDDESIYGNTTAFGSHNDVIHGQNGWDNLYGYDGNDTLDGGTGLYIDELIGGTGSDTFILHMPPNLGYGNTVVNEVVDFNTAEKDHLQISDLLIGYKTGFSNINDYVTFTSNGPNSIMSVDLDGKNSAHQAIQIAQIDNNVNLHADDMLAKGQLIVHGS